MKSILPYAILLAAMAGLQARPPWHAPEATQRIRFNVPLKTQANLFIPIPEETSPKDVAAFDDKGMVIPASPVRLEGKIIGAAVNAQKQAAPFLKHNPNPNASLYLLNAKGTQNLPYDGMPVHMTRVVKDVTTRAHGATEILRMIQNLHLIPFPQASVRHRTPVQQCIETDAFGKLKGHRNWLNCTFPKARPEARACVISSALLLVQEKTTLAFETTQPMVAWTVLLDATPVADWITAEQHATVTIQPGLHALQLVSIQSQNQKLPELLVRTKGKDNTPHPIANLIPSNVPDTLRLECRDVPQLAPETTALRLNTFAFFTQRPQDTVSVFKTATHARHAQFIRKDGANIDLPAPNVLIAQDTLRPATRLKAATQRFTFPDMPRIWRLSQAVRVELTVKAPPIVTAGQPLTLNIGLKLPEDIPQNLRNLVRIEVCHRPGTPGTAPQKQYHDARQQQITVAHGIPMTSACLEITALLHDTPITTPQTLKLIAPHDASLPLRASGNQLFCGNLPATLVAPANLMPDSSVEHRRDETQNTPAIVYDHFLLTSMAPGASACPQTRQLQWMAPKATAGTDPRLTFLANLHQLIAKTPKRAIFIIDPKMAADPQDRLWKPQTLFAAQACRLNSIRPQFVILPEIKGDDRFKNAKDAALNAKILTCDNQLETFDLYTRAKLNDTDTTQWKVAQGVQVNSLNDNARTWIFKNLK